MLGTWLVFKYILNVRLVFRYILMYLKTSHVPSMYPLGHNAGTLQEHLSTTVQMLLAITLQAHVEVTFQM